MKHVKSVPGDFFFLHVDVDVPEQLKLSINARKAF